MSLTAAPKPGRSRSTSAGRSFISASRHNFAAASSGIGGNAAKASPSGVPWNGLSDLDTIRSVETERSLQRVEMGLHALALRPDDFAALGEADRQSRARAADRQADAAELSPEPTVEIEKSEVQPRRRRD